MATRRDAITISLERCVAEYRSTDRQLADLIIPQSTYDKATILAKEVYFRERYSNSEVFTLLLKTDVQTLIEGERQIKSWQRGLKALLRYLNNLLLAPNRPELKTVKVCL